MSQSIQTQGFSAGEVILYPGTPTSKDNLFRVREGLVRLQVVDEEGQTLTLRFVRPGEFFGEEAISLSKRIYCAEAVTSARIETLSPDELSAHENAQLVQSLVESLSHSYQTIQRMTNQRLKNRIAATLIELSSTPVAFSEKNGDVGVRATHDEIASAVGSVRETVTKVIGELTREGYIRSGYGKLLLSNLGGLKDLATAVA